MTNSLSSCLSRFALFRGERKSGDWCSEEDGLDGGLRGRSEVRITKAKIIAMPTRTAAPASSCFIEMNSFIEMNCGYGALRLLCSVCNQIRLVGNRNLRVVEGYFLFACSPAFKEALSRRSCSNAHSSLSKYKSSATPNLPKQYEMRSCSANRASAESRTRTN